MLRSLNELHESFVLVLLPPRMVEVLVEQQDRSGDEAILGLFKDRDARAVQIGIHVDESKCLLVCCKESGQRVREPTNVQFRTGDIWNRRGEATLVKPGPPVLR